MLDIVSLRDITDLKKKLCNHVMIFMEGSVVVYIDTNSKMYSLLNSYVSSLYQCIIF